MRGRQLAYVSRLISLIDDAESRSRRQVTPSSVLSGVDEGNLIESENAVEERVMLDPSGNMPLKLYEVDTEKIEKLPAQGHMGSHVYSDY